MQLTQGCVQGTRKDYCKETPLTHQFPNLTTGTRACGGFAGLEPTGREEGLRKPAKLKESWNKWNTDLQLSSSFWRVTLSGKYFLHWWGGGDRLVLKQLLQTLLRSSSVTWDLPPVGQNLSQDHSAFWATDRLGLCSVAVGLRPLFGRQVETRWGLVCP
jgi:hypothetical protein